MARRIGEVDEFEFIPVGKNHNQGRLAVGILVSGFVFEEEDFIRPWEGCKDNLESDSHKSSSKALGRDIYNFEANPDIGVNSIHSCDTIDPTIKLEEDIEVIFSFSPDHFTLIDTQPWANDDPTIGDKMQEDVGIRAETSTFVEDPNIEDTLVPADDFKHELLKSTAQDLWKGRVFPDRDTFRRTLAKLWLLVVLAFVALFFL